MCRYFVDLSRSITDVKLLNVLIKSELNMQRMAHRIIVYGWRIFVCHYTYYTCKYK